MHRSTVEDLGGGVLNRAGRLSCPRRAPRPARAVAGVATIVAGALLVACAPGAADRPATADREDYALEIVEAVNGERSSAGLDPLALSTCAETQATSRATRLAADGGSLVHAPLEPVTDACPPASMSGENLSRASAPPADVVDAWMSSPGHRSNILARGFTQTGVACTDDTGPAGDGVLCSQVFLGP
ncbi:CAP domain-containing protein [Sanguibacter sp. 25GB23B1]|uniref:CAP domain-containing protein n=1 Tax=unclassified Sanguibacter TaxID=2645534 RepID=UPI0032AF0E8A